MRATIVYCQTVLVQLYYCIVVLLMIQFQDSRWEVGVFVCEEARVCSKVWWLQVQAKRGKLSGVMQSLVLYLFGIALFGLT